MKKTSIIMLMLAGLMGSGLAQYYPTVATKGAVADGDIAVYDGVSGRFIRSGALVDNIRVGMRSELGPNLCTLTGVYTGVMAAAGTAYTGTVAVGLGNLYMAGYTKSGAYGSVTMSVAGLRLSATMAGAVSNYFVSDGAATTNVVISIYGDGIHTNISNVNNVYVKLITNGNVWVAGNFYAKKLFIDGIQVSSGGLAGDVYLANNNVFGVGTKQTMPSAAIGTVILTNSGEQVINEGGTITPYSNVKVTNTNGTVITLGNPQVATNGVEDGTVMFLRGASGTGGIQFMNGAGVATDCELGFLLKPEDVMQFVFLGGKWTEVKRLDK